MSANAEADRPEQRRQKRVIIPEHPQILDAHSGEILGQLVNLSVDGLMAMGPRCIACGTICQLRIPLMKGEQELELRIGVESLWCEDANDSGSHWTGFHIIDISPEHQELLNSVVGD